MTIRENLDTQDPLFQKTRPVLLDIFSRGALVTNSWKMVSAILFSTLMKPVSWLVPIFKKSIPVIVAVALWWILRDGFGAHDAAGFVLLSIGVISSLYRGIHIHLMDFFARIAVVVTAGGALRWLASSYIEGSEFARHVMEASWMEPIVDMVQPVIQRQYRDQYDEFLYLYLDSAVPAYENTLNWMVEQYEMGHPFLQQFAQAGAVAIPVEKSDGSSRQDSSRK